MPSRIGAIPIENDPAGFQHDRALGDAQRRRDVLLDKHDRSLWPGRTDKVMSRSAVKPP